MARLRRKSEIPKLQAPTPSEIICSVNEGCSTSDFRIASPLDDLLYPQMPRMASSLGIASDSGIGEELGVGRGSAHGREDQKQGRKSEVRESKARDL
jgi:hypothetical protein